MGKSNFGLQKLNSGGNFLVSIKIISKLQFHPTKKHRVCVSAKCKKTFHVELFATESEAVKAVNVNKNTANCATKLNNLTTNFLSCFL